MRKIYVKRKRKQNHSNMRMLVAGTLALFFAVLLGMSLLQLGHMKTDAKGGKVTVGNCYDTGFDPFWRDVAVPRDLQISQNVSVKEKNGLWKDTVAFSYRGSDSDQSREIPNIKNISLNFSREGKFQPEISVDVANNLPTDGTTWYDSVGYERKTTSYRKFVLVSDSIKTYYKVNDSDVALQDNDTMGTQLFEYYKANYQAPSGKKNSVYKMLTTENNCGRSMDDILAACAKAYGWTEYTGQAIDLYLEGTSGQIGKTVKSIEMLTTTPYEFYVASEFANVEEGGSTGYSSTDMDIMLYTSHAYTFSYANGSEPTKLNRPHVETESGSNIEQGNAISEDDLIMLNAGDNPANAAKPQYYLGDVDSMTAIPWVDYTKPFSTDGKKYLYVRNDYASGNLQYIESDPHNVYPLSYLASSAAIVQSVPANEENVDVGDSISLSSVGTTGETAVFYVVGAEQAPELTRVSQQIREDLSLDALCKDGMHAQVGERIYLKINNLWYECSDPKVQKYVDSIVVDESIRQKNHMLIYAFAIDNDSEPGEFQCLRYVYAASEQAAAPEATIATSASSPAVIKMGSSIGLVCSTPGSKIFYTTNGSAPVIHITGDGPVAGSDYTYMFTEDSPIVVSEAIAGYGEDFLLMAQAVNYTEVDGEYYPVNQDSPVAKFIYTVDKQTPVKPVQSVPNTNSDTPTEVQIGSTIQLYSDTSEVAIYYTLDGSEPEIGNPEHLYSGAEGVVVPESKESSMFTITAVAVKDGMASSDISRLIFAYPGAVSAPYANPREGAVTDNTEVVLRTATEGAVIYYELTQDGKVPVDPTTSSKVFDASNPIIITKKTIIKAYAVKDSVESAVASFTYTLSDKLKAPTASIETGAVISSGTVITLTADKDATIYYTLDGSDPRDPANKNIQVGTQAVINGDGSDMAVLRTYAAKSGYTSSDVATYSYSFSAYIGGIYADRESGEVLENGEQIQLHTDMSDAHIFYTTDGSAPTTDSNYGSTVTIHGEPGEQVTVMAMAVPKGSEQATSFATFTYVIMNKLAAPTASVPNGATFTRESAVELKAESGRIYYTTDGKDPSTSSNLYKKSIVIDRAVTIKAIAVADDLETSEISVFNYGFAQQVAAPVASYASGELEMGTKVAFTSATEGATIYYRTDGKEINLSRKNELEIYTEPITINRATNFQVIAVKDTMRDSNILKVGYTVKEPIVIEAVETEETKIPDSQSNRLQSRRSFSDTESGPSYKDVVLRNASYGAVVAAEEGVLPDQVQLIVESAKVPDAVERRVKQVISESFGVVASYDVTLLVNGEESQPEGTIEIGLPIPAKYENAMIYIIHVQEDGNIELFETRRSGGVAYAKVDHFSVFSIAAPVEFEEEKTDFPWLPVIYTLTVCLISIGFWLIRKSKK